MTPPISDAVRATFEGYDEPIRTRLLEFRRLIFDAAADTPGVGPIEETLKWGEPAYLASATKSGTTVRLGPAKGRADRCCVFVHCQTTLVDTFRARYPDALRYEGTRAVVVDVDEPVPAELRAFIVAALTYHRRRR